MKFLVVQKKAPILMAMKSQTYLIILAVLAVGLGIHFFRRTPPKAEVMAVEERVNAPTAPDQAIPGMTETPTPTPVAGEAVAATPAAQEEPAPDNLQPISDNMTEMEQEGRVQQIFTPDNLESVEADWEHLDMQAEAEANDKGWRIHLLNQDTHFAKMGFHDGDFITKEAVLKAFEDRPDMVDRAMSVLNHISQ